MSAFAQVDGLVLVAAFREERIKRGGMHKVWGQNRIKRGPGTKVGL